jgi:ferric-dicitrate binding protein FerR (iron transport regulator)
MIDNQDLHYEIAALIGKHLQSSLTAIEAQKLQLWIEASDANRDLFNSLTDEALLMNELFLLDSFKASDGWATFTKTIQETTAPKTPITWGYKKYWYAAAAVLLMAFLTSVYFLKTPSKKVSSAISTQKSVNDVMPGGNKAMLQLADGTLVTLSDSLSGFQASQQNVKLVIKNGEISYASKGTSQENLFNKVITPRGGQYKLRLNDGTQIWLNAASSIRYPVSFVGNTRVVELTGEAYFDVAHDPQHPFIVKLSGNKQVRAIGTSFNINAYGDDNNDVATLIRGSIKVESGNNERLLVPGQQAKFLADDKLLLSNQVDVDEIVAWKNGQFVFNALTVKSIMVQLARWYELEVVYSGKISQETFSGIVSRNSNLSEVLKIMEAGGLRFKIDGKIIYVF